ncbi:MAG: Holliday junction branch migration DNA helicase RuvB [Clostridia bacterium]|nr:Holliday junction branch migration DNA helicase RuvB [Clostridia bacterium]
MEEQDRLITSTKTLTDSEVENRLRPTSFDEYVGQDKVKNNLKVYIQAAKQRHESLDHVLLYGPPGLGKTTLSHIIATEMGSQIKVTSGPAIEHAADLAAILTNLNKNDVLFIDEIHRLNRSVEEILYPAMEDFALDFIVGKGPSARSMRLKIQPFTLIGATTKAGNLSSPLRDRFGVLARLELYTTEDLCNILERSANILNVKLTKESAVEIARRSRGTPRIANRLLRRVRDFVQVQGKTIVELKDAEVAFGLMGIDSLGLDHTDKDILLAMMDKFGGAPVGLDTLSAATGEESSTIEDVVEPYLITLGFIARTPRGRVAMPLAYKHLGREVPANLAVDKDTNNE